MSVLALVSTRHEYDHLFSIYVPIAIGVFLVIALSVLAAVLIYRRRPPERAARWHEHNPLEGSYAVLLACTAAFLLYLTFSAEHRVDTVSLGERPAVVIDVTGSKWEWTFTYRSYGFSVRSGTVGRQPLVVPAGEAVRFNLTSTDVIHSFWIPALRYKHDAIPGSVQVTTLTFGRGVFAGQCAEFCGLRHADMIFVAHAVSPAAFSEWARRRGRGRTP
ncbi:MAG: cytochrome c oxidase subunit II [Solirubrobacterales bacterium]|nr:cytochrome c oxidase subunit II [Solirubrobacterales bacterium]MBV9941059.1 cytochrome c oxidase subunit II [Solirubrobacterales bacterium]